MNTRGSTALCLKINVVVWERKQRGQVAKEFEREGQILNTASRHFSDGGMFWSFTISFDWRPPVQPGIGHFQILDLLTWTGHVNSMR